MPHTSLYMFELGEGQYRVWAENFDRDDEICTIVAIDAYTGEIQRRAVSLEDVDNIQNLCADIKAVFAGLEVVS